MKRKRIVGIIVLMLSLAVFCLAACQPQTREVEAVEPEPTTLAQSGSTERDPGFFPEADYTTNFINAGNRGCGSCHGDDLYSFVSGYRQHLPYKDLATYGQGTKVTDCMTCHRPQAIGGGPMIGEAIHQAHYNNQAFTGNCFTCHATTNDGELVLFDEYIYTGELGGFPENVGSPEWQEWIALRGNVSGGDTIAGINVVNDWQLDKVELDQRTSSLEDLFCSVNGQVENIDVASYELKVGGGVNSLALSRLMN